MGRLKKLEYLNLALNNVTKVENLEGKLSYIVKTHIQSVNLHCHSRKKISGGYKVTSPFVVLVSTYRYSFAVLCRLRVLTKVGPYREFCWRTYKY